LGLLWCTVHTAKAEDLVRFQKGTHGLYLRESLIMTLIPFGTGAKLAL